MEKEKRKGEGEKRKEKELLKHTALVSLWFQGGLCGCHALGLGPRVGPKLGGVEFGIYGFG